MIKLKDIVNLINDNDVRIVDELGTEFIYSRVIIHRMLFRSNI